MLKVVGSRSIRHKLTSKQFNIISNLALPLELEEHMFEKRIEALRKFNKLSSVYIPLMIFRLNATRTYRLCAEIAKITSYCVRSKQMIGCSMKSLKEPHAQM